ncbi:MAG: hypothetical protein P8I56_09345 [Paracoccaceae bacterium]|nr:hypothetical protein [Paracoccaceae bacterium]
MPVAAYAFLISFALPALIALAAIYGGPFLAGVPIYAWGVTLLSACVAVLAALHETVF